MEKFTIKQMIEVGVHYGHDVRRWNPKMAPYIFKRFNNVHIVNLAKTAPLLQNALQKITDTVSKGGRVLFVGTKRQASPIIKEYAEKCGQYYINHRWLGGILTNWKTISNSINKLVELEKLIEGDMSGYTKKEQLSFKRKKEKLDLSLGGIRNMGGLPNILFVVDSKIENIAIAEATKLNIPVVAIVDTNSDPTTVQYPIPGNDDAIKAINFYCNLVCSAVLQGIENEASVSSTNKAKSQANAKAEKTTETKPKAEKKQEKNPTTNTIKKESATSEERKSTKENKSVVDEKSSDKKEKKED